MLKKIFIGLLVIIIVLQFIRPAKNRMEIPGTYGIGKQYPVPVNVVSILEKACYDCHSNTTRYPWYNNIQPVGWWLNNHIKKGKGELNFSEFGNYSFAKQAKKLHKVAKEVKEGGMPLNSYTWIHRDAILNEDDKTALVNWAEGLSKQIATVHNIDMSKKVPKS